MALLLALCLRCAPSPPRWGSGLRFQPNLGILADNACTPIAAPSRGPCTHSLGRPKQSTHISISNQSVFPSLAILTLVRTSSSRLNASGESEHPCFIFSLTDISSEIARTYQQWGINQRTSLFRKKFQGGKKSSQNLGLVATPFLPGIVFVLWRISKEEFTNRVRPFPPWFWGSWF